ncbi:MAG: hypothetical protein U0W40_16045 [Acidimicrobiia bacterium]
MAEPTEHSVAADLYLGLRSRDPRAEPVHPRRRPGDLRHRRLAQISPWSGTLEVGGTAMTVDPSTT